METILLKGAGTHELRLSAGEERRVVFLAAGPAEADIRAELAERARLHLVLLFAGGDDDRIRARIAVRHEGADSESRVIARGVLYNRSNAAIEGTIAIEPEAHGASAEFEGKAFADGSGSADILPVLEIQAPDVRKARHAAAVARLTPDERFYLESRGLDAEGSLRLAAEGFLKAPFSCAIEIPREFRIIEEKLQNRKS